MKLSHVPWMFVLVAVFLGEVHSASSDGLSTVHKIALDQSTQYPDGMTVKAVYVGFTNNNSIHVQLWKPSKDDMNKFTLVWQEEVQGVVLDGKPEVVLLKNQTVVTSSLRVGVQNTELPGPIDGLFAPQGDMRLSKNKYDVAITKGLAVEFDSLSMPRSFAVHLCNTTDCYYMMKHAPKAQPVIVRHTEDEEETLLTRGMIIALIAWNIAITFVLLIVIIAVICVCVDMDNGKSQRRRRENLARRSHVESRAYDNIEEPNNGVDPRWQTSDSWKPDSGMDTIDTTDEQKLTDDKSAL